jgi:hypothetical protein
MANPDLTLSPTSTESQPISLPQEKPTALETSNPKPLAIIQLGLLGDVTSLLRAVKRLSQTRDVTLVLAKGIVYDSFKNLPYCKVLEYDGEIARPEDSRLFYESKGYEAVCSQVFMNAVEPPVNSDHFNVEPWIRLGLGEKYYDEFPTLAESLPPLPAMAPIIGDRLAPILDHPFVVVCTEAHSAPFQHRQMFVSRLRHAVGPMPIVPIDGARFDSVWQLRHILRKCKANGGCLVTVDTFLGHLAEADMVPTVLLIPDRVWHTPAIRPHHIERVSYEMAVTERGLLKIGNAAQRAREPLTNRLILKKPQYRKLVHVVNVHECLPRDHARLERAAQTWIPSPLERKNVTLPYPKTDPPTLAEVVDYGISHTDNDEDLIMLTNSDTCLIPEIFTVVRMITEFQECIYSGRVDVVSSVPRQNLAALSNQMTYVGTDMFVFTVGWWKRVKETLPRMWLVREGWDGVLRWAMDGDQIGRYASEWPLCYHEVHMPAWGVPDEKSMENRTNAVKWASDKGWHKRLATDGRRLFKTDPEILAGL